MTIRKTFSFFQLIIHVTCKISINQQLMLRVRLLVNSRLLVVRVLGSQKSYVDFPWHGGREPVTPALSGVKCALMMSLRHLLAPFLSPGCLGASPQCLQVGSHCALSSLWDLGPSCLDGFLMLVNRFFEMWL